MSYQITQFYYPPRQIYLNSKFSNSTPDPIKNNRCYFSIKSIVIPAAYDNILVSIDDAQIPVSFYAINETNNTINIGFYADNMGNLDPDIYKNSRNYRDPGLSISLYMITYIIPVGNYDAYTLSNTLTTIVNNVWDISSNYMPTSIYLVICTYDAGVNKFIFDTKITANSNEYLLSKGLWVSFPLGTFGASGCMGI
jgi:hypothetical protein